MARCQGSVAARVVVVVVVMVLVLSSAPVLKIRTSFSKPKSFTAVYYRASRAVLISLTKAENFGYTDMCQSVAQVGTAVLVWRKANKGINSPFDSVVGPTFRIT